MWIIPSNHPMYSAFAPACVASKEDLNALSEILPSQLMGNRSLRHFQPGKSYQHEWEEPRTIEPGVGCTVNGYNFRNDLLRMYGNGVV